MFDEFTTTKKFLHLASMKCNQNCLRSDVLSTLSKSGYFQTLCPLCENIKPDSFRCE